MYRILGVGFVLFATAAFASNDGELLRELKQQSIRVEGKRVIVWAPGAWTNEQSAQVAKDLDRVVARVEEVIGRKFDAGTYDQARIEYVISQSEEIPSHVFAGYGHEPSAGHGPVVFLSGLDSGESPHIHETVHIVAGRFGSLLLREGLATYVQFAIQPGRMRPLVKLGDVTDIATLDVALQRVLADERNLELAKRWLANPAKSVGFRSRPERALFYAVSASFTAFLVERVGMDAVMKAYASDDRAAWQEWMSAWLASMTKKGGLAAAFFIDGSAEVSGLRRGGAPPASAAPRTT